MEKEIVKGQGEVIKIVSFEIGAYREEEITWKVQDDTVFVVGKRVSGSNGKSKARVEGGRFSRAIPIPEQVCASSISARFVGGGLFIVEGTKKTEKSKRKTSKTAYFDDMGFSVSVELNGAAVGALGGQDFLDKELGGNSHSGRSKTQRQLPSFDSFEEDVELFFRDDPLTDIIEERRKNSRSPLLANKRAATFS